MSGTRLIRKGNLSTQGHNNYVMKLSVRVSYILCFIIAVWIGYVTILRYLIAGEIVLFM